MQPNDYLASFDCDEMMYKDRKKALDDSNKQQFQLYGVFDNQTNLYCSLFLDESDEMAKRQICIAVNNPRSGNMYALFPKEFYLHRIAHFGRTDGKIVPIPGEKRLVCRCDDLIGKIDPVAIGIVKPVQEISDDGQSS